jgi:hypothetical protein
MLAINHHHNISKLARAGTSRKSYPANTLLQSRLLFQCTFKSNIAMHTCQHGYRQRRRRLGSHNERRASANPLSAFLQRTASSWYWHDLHPTELTWKQDIHHRQDSLTAGRNHCMQCASRHGPTRSCVMMSTSWLYAIAFADAHN